VLEKQTTLTDEAKTKVAKIKKSKLDKESEYDDVKDIVDKMEAKLGRLKEEILDVGGAKLRKEQDVAKKISKQIDDKTKQMTKIRIDFKNSQKNAEKNELALKKIEDDMKAAAKRIEETREELKAMEEQALEVLQTRESIQEEVTAKEEVLRKEEAKYRKLKKQYESMRSAEVDLQNNLEDCEKMLEENAKKETYWTTKLSSLHSAYTQEQKQNAGLYDGEDGTEEGGQARAKKPAKKAKKKSKVAKRPKKQGKKPTDEEGDVDMDGGEDEEDGSDQEDESKNERDSDEEMGEGGDEEEEDDEDDEDDGIDLPSDTLPMLAAETLSRYNKEEMKYEISVLEQQRDELKANVNMGALAEYKQKVEEYKGRVAELEDATAARDAKRFEYDELRRKRLEEFIAGFRVITLKLKEMYQMITLGGDAELELVDSLDPFSEGVVFSVRPSKKSWKNISNLSGGEKTLASLALVFALHHYKPTPLYVMDEIDAALDFKNVSIVGNYIKQRTRNAQFVIISLRNNMFELADRLVGIYKTNDATKSVTINPKVYESLLPSKSSGPGTPMNKGPRTPSRRVSMTPAVGGGDRRAAKKVRRDSHGAAVSTPLPPRPSDSDLTTPLRDRTNQG
jgi:structural maintenance of chromosome 4